MKLSYQGNVPFTPDGQSVLSIVGNRVSQWEISAASCQLRTLPFQARKNISCIGLSPNLHFLLAIDKDGRGILVGYGRGVVLGRINLKHPVNLVSFSPDSRMVAIAYPRFIQVWTLPDPLQPSSVSGYAPLSLLIRIRCHSSDLSSVHWSSCSRYLLTSSEDMTCKVLCIGGPRDYEPFTLAAHKDPLVGAFFSDSTCRQIVSVSREGAVYHWAWQPSEMLDGEPEGGNGGYWMSSKTGSWILSRKHFLNISSVGGGRGVQVSSAALSSGSSGCLAVGLSNGIFSVYSADLVALQSFSVFQSSVDAVSISGRDGSLVALASRHRGQLCVWDWSSETFLLKQQGRLAETTCLAYSPDGQLMASGCSDGRLLLWDTLTNFSFLAFNRDDSSFAPVSQCVFCKDGKVLLASYHDGTIRAFDLIRYRNFRTMSVPGTHFQSLSADPSGDLVAAGGYSSGSSEFAVYIWSLSKTGKLVDVLYGHTGNVVALGWDPRGRFLVSGSLDRTLRFWSLHSNSSSSVDLGSEVLGVAVRPDGLQVAACTLSGQVVLVEQQPEDSPVVSSSIDGWRDVRGGRLRGDLQTSKNSLQCFRCLEYSPDSTLLLAGGSSPFLSVYSVAAAGSVSFVTHLQVTGNLSLDGIRGKLLGDEGDEDLVSERIRLPGVGVEHGGGGNGGAATVAVSVVSVKMSGDARRIGAAGPEGIFVFSLDENLVFDPLDASVDATPERVYNLLQGSGDSAGEVLLIALKLNDPKTLSFALVRTAQLFPAQSALVRLIQERIPQGSVWADRLLGGLAALAQDSLSHVDLLLRWIQALLLTSGPGFKRKLAGRSSVGGASASHSRGVLASLRLLEAVLSRLYRPLGLLVNENRYLLEMALGRP